MKASQKQALLVRLEALHTAVAALEDLYDTDPDTFNEEQPESVQRCYAMSLDEWNVQCAHAISDVQAIVTKEDLDVELAKIADRYKDSALYNALFAAGMTEEMKAAFVKEFRKWV